jgi:DNA-directed RNA polymerase subunit M/transcription elongation factor TFIIS
MALRDRFSKKLTCPQCGNSGFAEASGLFVQRQTNFQETSVIKCECGRKFAFRTLAEAASGRD